MKKKATCNDFIMALPDGYGTIVGEGGFTLYGGEKNIVQCRISKVRRQVRKAVML